MLLRPGMFWISGNTPSSKNDRRLIRGKLVPGKSVREWVKNTEDQFKHQLPFFLKYLENLSPPYNIEFTFYRNSMQRFDYNNLSHAVTDAMKLHRWIPDDSAEYIKPYYGDYVYSKNQPGVLITILKQKPNHYNGYI